MKKLLVFLFICAPLFAIAQTDSKYLEGAIPLKKEKVAFTTELQVPMLTQDQLFETVLTWANERFKPNEKLSARVLYDNKNEGSIAIGGEEYIVFASSALSLDRTRIYYNLLVNCQPGKCDIEMTRIRYWYDEAREGGEKYTAEEWITDDIALNKSKTKLVPICGKFRKGTIDLKDEIFSSIQAVLGNKVLAMNPQPVAPAPVTIASPVTATTNTPVITATAAIPVISAPAPAAQTLTMDEQIAASSRMTITAGSDEQFELGKECWGGFGQLFGKEVAFCVIDQSKAIGNMLMEQNESYKISFYKEGNSEPWLMINCKKLMKQNLSGEEAKKMNADNDGQKAYNMYVGEVIK